MDKNRMDLLEFLRKRGMDGDLDFLREALQVLLEGIMDAEVSAQVGAQHGERNPYRVTHRNGYLSRDWDTWVGTMELRIPRVREGQLLPQPSGTAPAQPGGVAGGDPAGLRGNSVHSAGRRPGQVPGLRGQLQEPGLTHLPGPGTGGGSLPGPAPGPWAVSRIPTYGRRVDPEGQRGPEERQRQRGGGHRCERSRSAGSAGHGRGRQRERRLLAGLPALPEHSGSQQGGTGRQRCSPRFEERHRHGVCRSRLVRLWRTALTP